MREKKELMKKKTPAKEIFSTIYLQNPFLLPLSALARNMDTPREGLQRKAQAGYYRYIIFADRSHILSYQNIWKELQHL